MLFLGSTMAVVGFVLLWFSPYTGILTMIIGLGIVWSYEDQKIKKKNEKKIYEEEAERTFERLKYEDPVSPKLFELSTLLYGTIKPHETWLLEQLDELEFMYSTEAMKTIEETQDTSKGKFKGLFSSAEKYHNVCVFLSREYSREIFDDLNNIKKNSEAIAKTDDENSKSIPDLDDILEDYDLEEWARKLIKSEVEAEADRNAIIQTVMVRAKKELNKNISVSCLRDEWIINGRIKFKI